MAFSAMLSTACLAGPAFAGGFSGGSQGSGEAPRGVAGVELPFRDARPIEMPKLAPDEASRALPMTEGAVLKAMTARGITADGKDVVAEPSEALRDLVRKELSGGSAGPGDKKTFAPRRQSERKVFGDDDRIQIGIAEAEEYPFRVIGQILMMKKSGSSFCSGALIGPHTVLTAAHCLYNHDEGGWNEKIQFVPARTGTSAEDAPYGTYDYETAYVLGGYIDNYQGSYDSVFRWDLGVVILKDPVGDDLGWMGYSNYDDLGAFHASITGYPGDMPASTMWYAGCDVQAENIATDYFLTDCDTYPGSSGSAVYAIDENDEHVIVGVNVAQNDKWNTAVRLNASYFAWVDDLNQ